jgi:hypothetical protein
MDAAQTIQSHEEQERAQVGHEVRCALFAIGVIGALEREVTAGDRRAVDIVSLIPDSKAEDDAREKEAHAHLEQFRDRALEVLGNEQGAIEKVVRGTATREAVESLMKGVGELHQTLPLTNQALLEVERGIQLIRVYTRRGANSSAAKHLLRDAATLSPVLESACRSMIDDGLVASPEIPSGREAEVKRRVDLLRGLTLPEATSDSAYVNAEVALQSLPLISSTAEELEKTLREGGDFALAGREGRQEIFVPWEEENSFSPAPVRTIVPESDMGEAVGAFKERPPLTRTLGSDGSCVALGLIGWKEGEGGSQKARIAPLLLQPVQTVETEDGFTVRADDLEAVVNPLAKRFLKEWYSVDLPEASDFSTFGEFLEGVREAMRWRKNDLQLFDRAMLLDLPKPEAVFSDLAPDLWEESVFENRVLRKILLGEFESATVQSDQRRESLLPVPITPPVMALPYRQELLLQKVARGESVDLGRSLTSQEGVRFATAAIADAVWGGDPAVVVSPRGDTLEAYQNALHDLGMGELVMRLPEEDAQMPEVYEHLRELLLQDKPRVSSPVPLAESLVERDRRLHRMHSMLVSQIPHSGKTPAECVVELLGQDRIDRLFPLDRMVELQDSQYEALEGKVRELGRHLERMGNPAEHPFRGVACEERIDQFEFRSQLRDTRESIEQFRDAKQEVEEATGIEPTAEPQRESERIARLSELVEFLQRERKEDLVGDARGNGP